MNVARTADENIRATYLPCAGRDRNEAESFAGRAACEGRWR
jgi:hypothetical protein